MKRVALTGGIATGKSFVRAELERLGVPTIDADVLARHAVAPGTPGLDAVVARFGRGVLDSAGALNRHKLADIVFADPTARRELEAIVHPAVRSATDAFFETVDSDCPFAVAEIPLLYEVGRDRDFDLVIVAAVDPDTQVRRIVERDGLTEQEARARLAAQLPIDEKVRRANFVIETGGTIEQTRAQARRVVETIRGTR